MMYGVLDLEKSLCGDCGHYEVCIVPLRAESIGDDVFNMHVKVAITECRTYVKEDKLDGAEKRPVATA